MVVDSSALVAILKGESGWERLEEALLGAAVAVMSAATLVEASIVVEGIGGAAGVGKLDALLAAASIEVVPFDAAQARLAREAFRRFGKGRHRAGLNFGDCLTHALARQRAEPMLFRGNDFARTDVAPALSPP